jgi:hypothetical protein
LLGVFKGAKVRVLVSKTYHNLPALPDLKLPYQSWPWPAAPGAQIQHLTGFSAINTVQQSWQNGLVDISEIPQRLHRVRDQVSQKAGKSGMIVNFPKFQPLHGMAPSSLVTKVSLDRDPVAAKAASPFTCALANNWRNIE